MRRTDAIGIVVLIIVLSVLASLTGKSECDKRSPDERVELCR